MPAISGAPHDLRVLRDVRGFFLVYIGFRWQRGSAVNADGIYLHFVPDSQRRKGPDIGAPSSAGLGTGRAGPAVRHASMAVRRAAEVDRERRVSGQL